MLPDGRIDTEENFVATSRSLTTYLNGGDVRGAKTAHPAIGADDPATSQA
jgi:hypothetical protein